MNCSFNTFHVIKLIISNKIYILLKMPSMWTVHLLLTAKVFSEQVVFCLAIRWR